MLSHLKMAKILVYIYICNYVYVAKCLYMYINNYFHQTSTSLPIPQVSSIFIHLIYIPPPPPYPLPQPRPLSFFQSSCKTPILIAKQCAKYMHIANQTWHPFIFAHLQGCVRKTCEKGIIKDQHLGQIAKILKERIRGKQV